MHYLDFLMPACASGAPFSLLVFLMVPMLGMASNQEQQGGKWSYRDSTNVFFGLVTIHAAAITPFLRKGFGKEALMWPGFYAFFLILIIAGVNNCPSMVMYLYAWLAMLLWQRIYTWKLTRRGQILHSKFEGRFWLCGGKLGFLLELLTCGSLGYWFYSIGETVVGYFLMVGVVSILCRELLNLSIAQRQIQSMHDAQMEQQWRVQAFRKR
jgi:hypothetical protein